MKNQRRLTVGDEVQRDDEFDETLAPGKKIEIEIAVLPRTAGRLTVTATATATATATGTGPMPERGTTAPRTPFAWSLVARPAAADRPGAWKRVAVTPEITCIE
jgi:hypothetical protein